MKIIVNDVVDKTVSKHREELQKLALGIVVLQQNVVDELTYNISDSDFETLPESYDDMKKVVESSIMRHLVYVLRDAQHQIYKEP